MAPVLERGSLLGGRYELRGALGAPLAVVAGWDRVLERDVSIRVCVAERAEERACFLRDAKILARLQSPFVVGVYDVGPHGDETSPAFIVMEPFEGESLRARLDATGKLPAARAVAIARDVALGLAAVHAAGLQHGRVSPSSILFMKNADGTESVKLLDPGGGLDARGDVQSDLRALGAILFEMLELAHPSDPMLPLSAEVPRVVADVVRKCLSTTPGEQFDSARSVERALAGELELNEVTTPDFPELVLDSLPTVEAPAELVAPVHGAPPPKIVASIHDGPPELVLAGQERLDVALDLDPSVREAPIGRSLSDRDAPSAVTPLTVDGLVETVPAAPREAHAAPLPSPLVPYDVAPRPPHAAPLAPVAGPSSSFFAVLPAHVHMRLGVGALILGAMAFAFTQSAIIFAFFGAISLFGTIGYFVRRRADGLS